MYFFLPRGEVYTIDSLRFLSIGGADSIDKEWRIAYNQTHSDKVWWEEEAITEKQIQKCITSVQAKFNGEVDFVLSHSAPSSIEFMISHIIKTTPSAVQLQCLMDSISYKKWFFGHYHTEWSYKDYGHHYRCIYNDILQIK